MALNKIVRTVCLFTNRPDREAIARIGALSSRLVQLGINVQTARICSPDIEGIFAMDSEVSGGPYLSIGSLDQAAAMAALPRFLAAKNVAFNLDLTRTDISSRQVDILLTILSKNPAKTFSFAYTFNNTPSSPYFPSAAYAQDGFAAGLQPTDLSAGCRTIEEWLERVAALWREIDALFADEPDYIGLDTSIAPLFDGPGSLLNLVRLAGLDFETAATSDLFVRISRFIQEAGPRKTGLCGLMFPCLEDFELAAEYERGHFSVERNLFLSLHSGLGIDTYPIGMDEPPERLLQILRLVQALSNKYHKPLSVRFVSDGVTRIGQRAAFKHPYLKDVTIRAL